MNELELYPNFTHLITLPNEIAYTLNSKHCLLELILNKSYTYVQMHLIHYSKDMPKYIILGALFII